MDSLSCWSAARTVTGSKYFLDTEDRSMTAHADVNEIITWFRTIERQLRWTVHIPNHGDRVEVAS